MLATLKSGDPQAGSVLPVVVAVLSIAMLLTVGTVELGVRMVARAEAQSAADAAALAGAVEGRPGAADLAERNGSVLVGFEQIGGTVTVVVAKDGMRAEASARFDWPSVAVSAP